MNQNYIRRVGGDHLLKHGGPVTQPWEGQRNAIFRVEMMHVGQRHASQPALPEGHPPGRGGGNTAPSRRAEHTPAGTGEEAATPGPGSSGRASGSQRNKINKINKKQREEDGGEGSQLLPALPAQQPEAAGRDAEPIAPPQPLAPGKGVWGVTSCCRHRLPAPARCRRGWRRSRAPAPTRSLHPSSAPTPSSTAPRAPAPPREEPDGEELLSPGAAAAPPGGGAGREWGAEGGGKGGKERGGEACRGAGESTFSPGGALSPRRDQGAGWLSASCARPAAAGSWGPGGRRLLLLRRRRCALPHRLRPDAARGRRCFCHPAQRRLPPHHSERGGCGGGGSSSSAGTRRHYSPAGEPPPPAASRGCNGRPWGGGGVEGSPPPRCRRGSRAPLRRAPGLTRRAAAHANMAATATPEWLPRGRAFPPLGAADWLASAEGPNRRRAGKGWGRGKPSQWAGTSSRQATSPGAPLLPPPPRHLPEAETDGWEVEEEVASAPRGWGEAAAAATSPPRSEVPEGAALGLVTGRLFPRLRACHCWSGGGYRSELV